MTQNCPGEHHVADGGHVSQDTAPKLRLKHCLLPALSSEAKGAETSLCGHSKRPAMALGSIAALGSGWERHEQMKRFHNSVYSALAAVEHLRAGTSSGPNSAALQKKLDKNSNVANYISFPCIK